MLKLRIASRDLPGPWQWTGQQWESATSWIQPFPHPSLEPAAFTSGTRLVFLIRERQPGTKPSRDPVSLPGPGTEWSSQPGDFTAVTLDTAAGTARITAGAFGTAPVFACTQDRVLHASWDLTSLPLARAKLNEREIARLLTLRLRYTAETVFTGVCRVTERATAETTFTGPIRVRYPAAALHSAPRRLTAGADVTGAYENLLATVLAGHAWEPGRTLVELSGGADSANVALALAAQPDGHLVRTGAMILEGQRGTQQAARRHDLIRACGFTGPDITIPATRFPPFHPAGQRARNCAVSPYDEPYHEAMSELHRAAARSGIQHVFTGIGGDEMVSVSRKETDAAPVGSDRAIMPWITKRTRQAAEHADHGIAPASHINEMTLIAAGCAAPVILTSGSWPVHPLADPRLITFGEWLPEQWRRGKRLHRDRLTRRGLARTTAHPQIPEIFTGIMDQGLRNHGTHLARQICRHGGHLTDSGYVDAAQLAEACDRITSGTARPRDREIFDVLALELSIATLTSGPTHGRQPSCS